jgi:hypothetical protein
MGEFSVFQFGGLSAFGFETVSSFRGLALKTDKLTN